MTYFRQGSSIFARGVDSGAEGAAGEDDAVNADLDTTVNADVDVEEGAAKDTDDAAEDDTADATEDTDEGTDEGLGLDKGATWPIVSTDASAATSGETSGAFGMSALGTGRSRR